MYESRETNWFLISILALLAVSLAAIMFNLELEDMLASMGDKWDVAFSWWKGLWIPLIESLQQKYTP